MPEGSEKIDGDDESGSMTPNSAASPTPGDDEGNSPPAGDLPSPRSSVNEDVTSLQHHMAEKYVFKQTYCSYLVPIICSVLLSFYLLLVCCEIVCFFRLI